VSNGTYRIDVVRNAFLRGARHLQALAKGRNINDTSINYLSVSGMRRTSLW
jgi:non-canonical poly(A) RNA polymerase PAPD5/7